MILQQTKTCGTHRVICSLFFIFFLVSSVQAHNPQTSSILLLASTMPPEPSPRSFYKRTLPESCVALSSKRGKEVFASSLANAGLKSFFPLIEQL
jgi:hypothetical protein